MSEIRHNLIKNKWVAVAEDRALKPNDFPIARHTLTSSRVGFCPFCAGNEDYTPPEITAYREEYQADAKGWLVRAIPNKFSAFELDGVLEKKQTGIYHSYNGLGRHEVVIETPEHGVEFHDLSLAQIEIILGILKDRYNDLSADKRIKYIQLYKNRGMFAGASLEHSHSQIVGLPFVPRENEGMPYYFREKKSCLLCDIMNQERESQRRLIFESPYFMLLCPYAPRFPYESWIIPNRHNEHFGGITADEVQDLALLLKQFITVMMDCLNNPSYNLVVNTAPVNVEHADGYHWYIEVTPRLLVNAGVEIATGVYINPVSPELAAALFREKTPAGF